MVFDTFGVNMSKYFVDDNVCERGEEHVAQAEIVHVAHVQRLLEIRHHADQTQHARAQQI